MPPSDRIMLGDRNSSPIIHQKKTKTYISLLNSRMKKHKKDFKRKKKDYNEFKNRNVNLNKNRTQINPQIEKILQKQENPFLEIIEYYEQKENEINLKLDQANHLDSLFTGYIKNSNFNRLNEIETLWDELELKFFDGKHLNLKIDRSFRKNRK